MKRNFTLFLFALFSLTVAISGDYLHWGKISSIKTADAEFSSIYHSPFTASNGYHQTFLLKRAMLPDSIYSDGVFYFEDFLTMFYDTCRIKHQVDVFFEYDSAVESGYYNYCYYTVYEQNKVIDSVYVVIKKVAQQIYPPDRPTIENIPDFKVVNLIVVDEKGLTKLKVLNLEEYNNKVEINVFSSTGKSVYSSVDYNNDFDMRNCKEDTYYYILSTMNGKKIKKGFVQLYKK
jgi:hypothetical protein